MSIIIPITFTVPLSFEAHQLAQKFRDYTTEQRKSKQVYLNTLAVYAVDYYLRCLGWKTEAPHSDSRNPIILSFMDVADLLVKPLGKIECRPVLPNEQVVQIPPDVRSDRVAYVAVRMSRSLQEATLLGFTEKAEAEVPIKKLRALSEFPEYLNSIRQTAQEAQQNAVISAKRVNLQKWLEGVFEAPWSSLDALLDIRSKPLVPVRDMTQVKSSIKRAKLIDCGVQLEEQRVVLAMVITPNENETVSVGVQLYPSRGETYLPPHLKLTMLSESGEILQEVQSSYKYNYIKLREIRGKTGDSFGIQVSLDDVKVSEYFVL